MKKLTYGSMLLALCGGLLSSALALGAFSLCLALEYYILQAPDVAIAEAAIGAGLSTVIYIIALRACGQVMKGNGGGAK